MKKWSATVTYSNPFISDSDSETFKKHLFATNEEQTQEKTIVMFKDRTETLPYAHGAIEVESA